ncbi:hypothetical protein RU639_002361 [Aspergillus parasiticus]
MAHVEALFYQGNGTKDPPLESICKSHFLMNTPLWSRNLNFIQNSSHPNTGLPEQLLLHLAFKEIQPFTMDGGLGVQADLTTQQGLRSYRGYAGIKTRHLTFEEQGTLWSKPFDQKNIERLQAIFDEVGCQPLEPDHRIAAIISDDILRTSLELSYHAGTDLMDNTNPPSLRLADNTHLLCLYGKHRGPHAF